MYKKLLPVIILLFIVTACSSPAKKEDQASVEDKSMATTEGSGTDDTDSSARSYGTGDDTAGDLSALDDPTSPLSVRTIYFAYDSSTIQPQFNDAIQAHAGFLSNNPNVTISLEGHADERGSREYNLALGERRAQAVKQQLVLLGASASQIRTTSYGEERPVANGHDEQSMGTKSTG